MEKSESNINLESNNDIKTSYAISYLGTNASYFNVNTGNGGGGRQLVGMFNYTYGNKKAKTKCSTAGIGSADAWAYISAPVEVVGQGTRAARVIFNGNYFGRLFSVNLGGTSSGRVKVSVYDQTIGQVVSEATILDETLQYSPLGKTYSGDINYTLYTYLEGGHRYLLRFSNGTAFANYSPQIVLADFYDSNRIII